MYWFLHHQPKHAINDHAWFNQVEPVSTDIRMMAAQIHKERCLEFRAKHVLFAQGSFVACHSKSLCHFESQILRARSEIEVKKQTRDARETASCGEQAKRKLLSHNTESIGAREGFRRYALRASASTVHPDDSSASRTSDSSTSVASFAAADSARRLAVAASRAATNACEAATCAS